MSELSPEARGLLDETRSGDQPSAHDRERLRGKLMVELGAAAFAGATVAAAATASSSAAASAAPAATGAAGTGAVASGGFGALTLGKLALAATLVGALGAGVFVSLRGEPPAPTPATLASKLVNPAPIAEPMPAPVVTQLEPAATEAPTEPSVEARAKPARRAQRAEKPVEQAAPEETDSADALTAELDLLSRAQAALRNNDPKLALSLVHEHEARFANGSLREERIGVAALSRCRLGEDHAAVLAEFEQAAPHSPMAARVRAACASAVK